jgi:hypothetical protein
VLSCLRAQFRALVGVNACTRSENILRIKAPERGSLSRPLRRLTCFAGSRYGSRRRRRAPVPVSDDRGPESAIAPRKGSAQLGRLRTQFSIPDRKLLYAHCNCPPRRSCRASNCSGSSGSAGKRSSHHSSYDPKHSGRTSSIPFRN